MPYIPSDRRDELKERLTIPETEGELNYLITSILDEFLVAHGLSYTTINAVMGVLSCAQAEFYRRVAAPYEDIKMSLNGDVFNEFNLVGRTENEE